jgi:hypothetical protein
MFYRDGKLDRQYLRVCAAYKLLKQGRIGKERAIELMERRRIIRPEATVELWLSGPLKKVAAP